MLALRTYGCLLCQILLRTVNAFFLNNSLLYKRSTSGIWWNTAFHKMSSCCYVLFRLNILSAVRRLYGTNCSPNKGREPWLPVLEWHHSTIYQGIILIIQLCIIQYIHIIYAVCICCFSPLNKLFLVMCTCCICLLNSVLFFGCYCCFYVFKTGTVLSTCSCKVMRNHGLRQRNPTLKINS